MDWTERDDFEFWTDLTGTIEAGIFMRQAVQDWKNGTVEKSGVQWIERRRSEWAEKCRIKITKLDRVLKYLMQPENGSFLFCARKRNAVGIPVLHVSLRWENIDQKAQKVVEALSVEAS